MEAEVAPIILLCHMLYVYHVDRAFHIPGGRGFSPLMRMHELHLVPTARPRPDAVPLGLMAQVRFFHSVQPRAQSRAVRLYCAWLVSLEVRLRDSSSCVAVDHQRPGLSSLPPCVFTAAGPLGRPPRRPLGNVGARVLWGPHACLAAGRHWCGHAHTQAAAAPASPPLPTAAWEFQLLHVLTHTQCRCGAFILLSDTVSVTPQERSKPGQGGGAGGRCIGNRLPGLEVPSLFTLRVEGNRKEPHVPPQRWLCPAGRGFGTRPTLLVAKFRGCWSGNGWPPEGAW